MINYISGLVLVVLLVIGAAIALAIGLTYPIVAILVAVVWFVAAVIASSSIKLAAQWEQALVFRLGKYHGIRGPGLFLIVPLVDQVRMIDIRIRATDIPAQQVITKDNVPVTINGVFFFKVDNVADAVIKVQRLPLCHLAVRANVAARCHRPDDPRPAARRTRTDRQGDRSQRREGHRGLGIGGHRHSDSGHQYARGTQKDDVPPGIGRTREAGDHHQGRRRSRSVRQLGGGRQNDGSQPRSDAIADVADHRRLGAYRLEYSRPGHTDRCDGRVAFLYAIEPAPQWSSRPVSCRINLKGVVMEDLKELENEIRIKLAFATDRRQVEQESSDRKSGGG